MANTKPVARILLPAKSNRCFDVTLDHGFFTPPGFLQGIEDMRAVVNTLIEAGPPAIQLTGRQARHLQELPGPNQTSLVF
jgi:fructose-bisphosphate aldolase, class I